MNSIRHEPKDMCLTSVEMGILWNTYMIESMVHHVFSYFSKHIEDSNIKDIILTNVDMTKDSLGLLESFFRQENIPVPRGITSEDVNLDAPRLFFDVFYVRYLNSMDRFALSTYGLSYSQCSRDDMRKFVKHYVDRLVLVDQQVVDLMKAKGLHIRPPYIAVPHQVDFVKKQSFLTGFFGEKRPLTVLEITHLFFNAINNGLGKALLTGFAQVTKSEELHDFFIRGKDMSNKYFKNLTDVLLNEDIQTPPSFDGEVLESKVSPFSERLMLFHTNLLISSGLGSYGLAMAASPRRDLAAMYAKMMTEVAAYAEDGANLMIKNGWLEQPPSAH